MWENVQVLLSLFPIQELLKRKKNKSANKLMLFNSLGKN
jgi:hypothetical protein